MDKGLKPGISWRCLKSGFRLVFAGGVHAAQEPALAVHRI